METTIYVAIEGNVQKKSNKAFGYVLEYVSDLPCSDNTVTRQGFGYTEATLHQATLVALIEAFKRFIRPSQIEIKIEDEFVANMIENNLQAWEENGFKNAKGKPIANAEEWQQLAKLLKTHEIKVTAGHHEYSNWLCEEIRRKK